LKRLISLFLLLKDVDIKNYTKYLLEEGTIVGKREMLECLKSKLILKDKKNAFSII